MTARAARPRLVPTAVMTGLAALASAVAVMPPNPAAALPAAVHEPRSPPLAVPAAKTKPLRPPAKPEAAPVPAPQPPQAPAAPSVPPPAAASQPAGSPAEIVEADVSTHTVAVTSAFSGTEIVVFGTVANSRQDSAESGYYDIVVLVEGRGASTIVRLKDNVGGLWLNTRAVRFANLPLYWAIASTRPIEEIAEPRILVASGIGFARARMQPTKGSSRVTPEELEGYKAAVLRLKARDGLYVRQDFGVAFIGRALFRASVKLPANIPVGPLEARIYLFQDGRLLSTNTVSVMLERAGLERLIYDFAHEHPVWHGLLAVTIAALSGLAATALFRRPAG